MGLLLGLIISIVGFAYFRYGKRNLDNLYLISGLVLMISPYFIGNRLWMILVSLVIIALPIVINKMR